MNMNQITLYDIVAALYDKLNENELNLLIEFTLFSLLFTIGGLIILYMNPHRILSDNPRKIAEREEDLLRGRGPNDHQLSKILQRQYEQGIWENWGQAAPSPQLGQNPAPARAYDSFPSSSRCHMDYELKVRLWTMVQLSPKLKMDYQAGSSIGTVYIKRSRSKLVSTPQVIWEVKKLENIGYGS